MRRVTKGSLEVLTFNHIEAVHGFTTRKGGVSKGGYSGLNFGLESGDQRQDVLENYRRLFDAFGIDKKLTAATQQTHSDHIKKIETLEDFSVFEDTDGLMTDQKGITLMAYYADCTPLFFYDPIQQVVAVVHSGWKGTMRKIGMKMVESLAESYGSRPEDLKVGIGPNISLDAYEVNDAFLDGFDDPEFFRPFLVQMPNGRKHFDLVEANRALLLQSGIRPENLTTSGHCTFSEPELFFSYRRQGPEYGVMSGFIRLE